MIPELWDLPAAEEAEFELSGLNGFQDTLAGVLAQRRKTIADIGLPPGLAPPPGLGLPPGLLEVQIQDLETSEGPETSPSPTCSEETSLSPSLPAGCTTVMLRNIPNKYSREKLAAQLHEDGFSGDMDFLYLPIDFRNKCNVGYAFVSFRTAEACTRFAASYHLRNAVDKLPGFKSKKVCEVSEARCQGREENVRRLQSSSVMQQLAGKPEWLPALFDEQGQQQEFPVPTVKQATVPASKVGRVSWGGK